MRNREATEKRIETAFGTLLQRDGVSAIGINAIAREAGVGKELVYRYFGGLEGVAEAWLRSAQLLPDAGELIGDDLSRFLAKSEGERIQMIFSNYVRCIKDRRGSLQVLAAELLGKSAFSEALETIRRAERSHLMRLFQQPEPDTALDMEIVGPLLAAGVLYLAMSSNTVDAPYTIPLNTDEGWQRLEQTVSQLVGLAWNK